MEIFSLRPLTNKSLYTNIDEYVYIELSVSGFNVKTLL